MQSQTREESWNIPLDYCSLLIELGIPQILSIKTEINRQTPEVKKFFSTLGTVQIRRRLNTVYGAKICKEKGGSFNGEIHYLNRFLQGIDLKTVYLKKPFDVPYYRIISNTSETLEDVREVIDTGDKDKIIATFAKRFNYEKLTFGKKPGVYEIRCVPTGDCYIGSSGHIPNRIQAHKSYLNSGKLSHHSQKLQELWNTYGKSCFEFSVLEYTMGAKYLKREEYYIKTRRPSLNTMHSPNAVPHNRVKIPPEMKEELFSLSGFLGMDTNELVRQLLTIGLKEFGSGEGF
jgi:predicted GIY-YIG superfamily endonuclease